MEEEASVTPSSSLPPVEAPAEEEQVTTEQGSTNIIEALDDDCFVTSPILKAVPGPDLSSTLLLLGSKYNNLVKSHQALRSDCEVLRKKCAEVSSNGSLKHSADDTSAPLSPIAVPAQKQLKYTAGIVNSPSKGTVTFDNQPLKMVPIGHLSTGKKLAIIGQGGKLWRWKRSHHQWLLQFKWKWQKPWKLSEWIRHSDQTIMRVRPRPLPLRDIL